MFKINERPTKDKIHWEKQKIKKIYPALERTQGTLSLFERVVGRYDEAVVETANVYPDLTGAHIKMIAWMYPYLFFEKEFFYDNHILWDKRANNNGTRHNMNKFGQLIRLGYVELYKHRSHKFFEEEYRGTHYVITERVSKDTYTLSRKGVKVAKTFFEALINMTPIQMDTDNRVVMKLKQKREELDNINGGWDAIIAAF